MKKIFTKIYVTLIFMTALSACDVLNQEPLSLLPTAEAIVDRQSAVAAVNGIYNSLQSGDLYGGQFIMASEMLSKNARAAAFQAFWLELQSGNVSTSNAYVEDNWISNFAVINAANNVIVSVPPIEGIGDEEKDVMLGTAYFLRSLANFDLLKQYGEFFDLSSTYGIPLVLEPSLEVKETARSSVAASYEQIETDLESAIELLDNNPDRFYASKATAQALLARVYLYEKEFDKAAAMASAVIENPNYALTPNYNDIYLSEGASKESIFELNFVNLVNPNSWGIDMYSTPPEVAVGNSLVEFFDTQNEGERSTLFVDISGYIRCTKYGVDPNNEGANTIVLRISEMYLIRAEALGRTGVPADALPDLNAVHERAGLPPITPAQVSTEEALITVLLNERRAEFAFEGQYWFDLVRYGRMESTLDRQPYQRIYPIPQRDMNITDGTLVQNPGY